MKRKLKQWKSPVNFQKKIMIMSAIILCVALAAGIFFAAVSRKNEEIAYRETTVESGNLTVGVTESGSVDIGTQQTHRILQPQPQSQGDPVVWGKGIPPEAF